MRVYIFSGLERFGRLGNQLWQTSAIVSRSADDLGSRPFIKPDWEYRPFFSLPEDFYEPPEATDQVIDMIHDRRGPFFQRSSDIQAADVESMFYPSSLALGGLVRRYYDFVGGWRGGHKTAIHVRRGDYLSSPLKFPTLTAHYYQSAMKTLLAEQPETHVLVFSDDIPWCRQNEDYLGIEDVPHSFIEGHVRPISPRARTTPPDDIFDFLLMTSCDSLIIANSTFSWWAARLTDNAHGPGSHVFYPEIWFGGGIEPFNSFPSSWTRIPC